MRPEPVFEAPWHAQLFAMTVHLNESGVFDWADWAEAFGATLKHHGMRREMNGGEDYFNAWLETLEGLLVCRGLASAGRMENLRAAWEEAYLNTPHGEPVQLVR